MSQAPISPLRRRMIEDMTVRGFGEKTQSDYIRHVKNFTIFLGRSPDQAQPEDLRLYQLHQREQGVQPPTMNGAVAALRFFFTRTCNRPEMARHLTLVRQPQKLPVVPTLEAMWRSWTKLLRAPSTRPRSGSRTAPGCACRRLPTCGSRTSTMVIRVEQEQRQEGPQRQAVTAAAGAAAGVVAWLDGRRRGCFRAVIRCCRSRHASSIGS